MWQHKSTLCHKYRGADKSLARPGSKQATATEDFDVHIYNHNWRNISTVYIYNKTSIKRNILTIKIHREVGRAKDLSAPRYEQCTRESSSVSGTRVFRQFARQPTTHSFQLPNKQAIIYLARPCNIDASLCRSTKGHTRM